jgi:hypothetical protein
VSATWSSRFARAALALDQHRDVRVRHLVEQVPHAAHGRAGPDCGIPRLVEPTGEPVALAEQRPLLEDLLECGLELLRLEGLVQVVGRPEAHRLDDRAGLAHHREHDHRDLGVELPDAGERPDPVEPGHHHVQDHHVGGRAALEQPQGPAAVLGGVDLVALELEQVHQVAANALGVVDDEGAKRGSGGSGGPGRAACPRRTPLLAALARHL